MSTNRLDGIQVLRGLAALAVVIGHNRGLYGDIEPRSLIDYITSNAIFGVEVFFVISGFIITYSTQKIASPSLNNTLSFLIKRLFRIYPLYILVLVVYVTSFYYNYATGYYSGGELSINNIIKSALLLPLDPTISPPYYGWGTLVVSWTLKYEMYFYFLFALSLLFSVRYRTLITSFMILLISFSLSYYIHGEIIINAHNFTLSNNSLAWYFGFIGNPMVFDFILGMLIAELSVSLKNNNAFNCTLMGYVSILILTIVVFSGWPVFMPAMALQNQD